MSRSGYTDDFDDQWGLIMYRGRVTSAIRGKRGQAFLLELLAALDAMPEKRLIAESLKVEEGAVCALGAVAAKRGFEAEKIKHLNNQFDYGAADYVAQEFGIAEVMTREIVWVNDEAGNGHSEVDIYDGKRRWYPETPEERFERVRAWVVSQVRPVPIDDAPAPSR